MARYVTNQRVHLLSAVCKAPCDQTWHWSNPTWPHIQRKRVAKEGCSDGGGLLWCRYKRFAIGSCHTYTPISSNDSTHTHTQARHTVGANRGFQGMIEQRRHLQASVRGYIRAERRWIWSRFNALRWIIKAKADLSCRFQLSGPCDHGVIMSCVLRSATCQPVVFGLTAAFHLGLRFVCSFSPTDVHWCRAKRPQRENPTGTNPMFLHKVGCVITFMPKLYLFTQEKRSFIDAVWKLPIQSLRGFSWDLMLKNGGSHVSNDNVHTLPLLTLSSTF